MIITTGNPHIDQILDCVTVKPCHDIIEQLSEISDDEMNEARELLFKHAVDILRERLSVQDINDKVDLTLCKRQPKRGKNTRLLESDVMLLYEYVYNLRDSFPKEVFHTSSNNRYVDLVKSSIQEPLPEPPECNGVTHIMLLAQILEIKGRTERVPPKD